MQRGQSILEVLAPELLELIIREVPGRDAHDLATLRLVCKTLKEQVNPHLFARLTINFSKNTIPGTLEAIVSGASPFVRWAKFLRVDKLVPLVINVSSPRSESRWPWKGEEREKKLACQKEWLIPAIRSLLRVERVQFVAQFTIFAKDFSLISWAELLIRRIYPNVEEPYHDCLCALAELPRVRELEVNFCSYHPILGEVPLGRFSNLRSVQLKAPVLTPHGLEDIKRLLSQSPSITHLCLVQPVERKENGGGGVEFSSLVDYAVWNRTRNIAGSTTFSPTLKKLTIDTRGFKLSPSCVPFLGALTSLTILGDSSNVQPSFWESLQDSGIRLWKLRVCSLFQPTVDYLLSYSGLRDFTIKSSVLKQPEDVVRQFFHCVLPMHQSTMEALTVREMMVGPWMVTQSYLDEGVFLCRNLRFLKLMFFFPSPTETGAFSTVPIENVLGGICENLPRLQRVKLDCPMKRMTRPLSSDFKQAFSAYIVHETPPFYSKCRPRFVLQALSVTLVSTTAPGLGQYRFKEADD